MRPTRPVPPPLQPNDANTAWVQVLNELRALWAAEGSIAHYYGVVKVPYTSGVIGLSYLPSFVAVGYDNLPNAAATMVHELGHNFGRLHSPSCGAGGVDGNYPYAQGAIGVYGYDGVTGALSAHPRLTSWATAASAGSATTRSPGFSALDQPWRTCSPRRWRIPHSQGFWFGAGSARTGIVLEPAFEVNAPREASDVWWPAHGGRTRRVRKGPDVAFLQRGSSGGRAGR